MVMLEMGPQGEDAGDGAVRTSTLGSGKEKQPPMEVKDSEREEEGQPERPVS